MIVLLIILLVLLALLMSPVKLEIKYLLYKEKNIFTIKTGVFIPFITVFSSGKGKKAEKIKQENENKNSVKSKFSLSFFADALEEVGTLFSYFKKKLKITELRLHFHIGAPDAAATGILTGSAWGTLYNIVAILENNFSLYEKNIHVSPDFTREVFETDIKIKLSIKVFYLMIFGVRTLRCLKRLNILKPERNEN